MSRRIRHGNTVRDCHTDPEPLQLVSPPGPALIATVRDPQLSGLPGGIEHAHPPRQTLHHEMKRVTHRLGTGRPPIPATLGGGLFAQAILPQPESPQRADNPRTDVSNPFLVRIANTRNARSLSHLPAESLARADELTVKFTQILQKHAGSTTGRHDSHGLPITSATYPNLVVLQQDYREFASRTVHLGNQLRKQAKRAARAQAPHPLTAALTDWTGHADHFQQRIDSFTPDNSDALRRLHANWSLAQDLYRRYTALRPPEPSNPLKSTVPVHQSDLQRAQKTLQALEKQAHENAILHLIVTQPTLWSTDNPLTPFAGAYQEGLRNARGQHDAHRHRLQRLVEDLQAPVHEQGARSYRRFADRIQIILEDFRLRRRRRTPRQFREEIRAILAELGFGAQLSASLSRFEHYARNEFRTLALLASRRYLPRLKAQMTQATALPHLVVRTHRAVEEYLTILHRGYLEAADSLAFLARNHLAISAAIEHLTVATSNTLAATTTTLVETKFDFHRSYPAARTWTTRLPYVPEIADITPPSLRVEADHQVLIDELQYLESTIARSRRAILSRINPRTNRKITRLAALEEQELPHILRALRETELLLADYQVKYGSEAAAAFAQHLMCAHLSAAHHVLTLGRADEDAYLIEVFGRADLGKRRPVTKDTNA